MSLIQKEIYEFGPFTVDPAERVAVVADLHAAVALVGRKLHAVAAGDFEMRR